MRKFNLLVISLLLTVQASPAVSIIWDYTYDSSGFFTTERKAVLQAAGDTFSNYSIASQELKPGGGNSWSWQFTNPTTTANTTISNPTVLPGQLTIYVGARDLGASELGLGGNLGLNASGTQAWIEKLQSFNTADTFMPFNGVITINSTSNWYSGLPNEIPSNAYDLYSVAIHEIGHVFGIGTSTTKAWLANIDEVNHLYIGTEGVAAYGGSIPLLADNSHFAYDTAFDGSPLVMDPNIAMGVRASWSPVEFGVMRDLGYVTIPEPTTTALVIFSLSLLFLIMHKRLYPLRPAAPASHHTSESH
ncbi:MAG: matrixin family metalloprotease [Chthoniobacterales bacterium]